MSKTVREIPASELIERALTVARIASTNDEVRAWGALNDVYLQELPAKADWTFRLATSSLVTAAKYATGTCSINTGATTVSFSGATIVTGMTGRKIRFNDNPNVYDFTFVDNSTGTISPYLSEDRNISGGVFTIYQPVYTLAADFDRFPKNGGLQLWAGAKPTPIPEDAIQTHYSDFSASPGRPSYCRLITPDTANVPQLELGPPPDKVYQMPYDYFYHPAPLRETTAGVCTVAASGTGATFQGGARLIEAGSGWYFRVDAFGTDANSEWHRIIGISVANSNVIFQTAFEVSGATSASYTLCNAPVLPLVLQGALLHGTVKRLLADENDQVFVYADSLQTAAIHDAKRLYKTRTYNQEVETILEDYQYRR